MQTIDDFINQYGDRQVRLESVDLVLNNARFVSELTDEAGDIYIGDITACVELSALKLSHGTIRSADSWLTPNTYSLKDLRPNYIVVRVYADGESKYKEYFR
jgi:hypothetical protein